MEPKPLVSVIIPAYNAAPYIKEAVESAIAQTYKNIEVIVVDDGSTDNTKEVLAPFIGEKAIYYFYQPNKGLAGARNAGIKQARGEFIAFLDADDIFLPEKVARQVEILAGNTAYGACYCDMLHFTDTDPRIFYHHAYRYPSGDIFKSLLHRQFVNPLSLVVRREVFDRFGYFDETLRRSEDWDILLRFAHAGVLFYYLDEVLAHYRMRSAGNLSSIESEPQMKQKNLEFFEHFGKTLTPNEWQKYNFPAIIRKLQRKVSLAYLLVGDKKMALARSSGFLKFCISLVPAALLKTVSRLALKAKHRSLLRKV